MASVCSVRNEVICPYIKKSMNYNPIFYFYRVHWIPNVIWSPDNVLAEIKLKDVDAMNVLTATSILTTKVPLLHVFPANVIIMLILAIAKLENVIVSIIPLDMSVR